MSHVHIVYTSAVGSDIALIIPFVEKDIGHQHIISAAGLTEEAVVGRHHTCNSGFGHKLAEGWKICIPQVVIAYISIKGMSVPFRAAVNGIMLGTGRGLEVLRIVALNTFDEG